MFERWYEIIGVTPAMYNVWKDNMRKDIIAWEEDGLMHIHICVNPIEALWIKFQIYCNNKKKEAHYYYKLRLAE